MPTAAPAEQRVLLRNISWETYERLLAEVVDVAGTHFFYGDGNLEIMTVGLRHEVAKSALSRIVETTAEETEVDFCATGRATCVRRDLRKGFEPDASFYFQHAAQVRDIEQVDLATDPPPELIIEVDITPSRFNHFPLYTAIGIAEIWRYDGQRVSFHRLERGAYSEIQESIVLPPMTAAQATIFVELDRHEEAIAWLRTVRQWIRNAL